MRKSLLLFGIIISCTTSINAFAILPESGWYWNSNESGRGYAIEIQDDKVFFATFTYDTTGKNGWLVAVGKMSSDRAFSGSLYQYAGGPCFGCTQTNPTSQIVGSISINWIDEINATLNILNTQIPIRRFDFGGENTITPNALFGEWSFTEGSNGSFFGERIIFNTLDPTDTSFAKGFRSGDNQRPAIGKFTNSYWTILLDSSTSYYRYYELSWTGFNKLEGYSWTYLKGQQPTGSGLRVVASRTASKAFVTNGIGPATAKSVRNGSDLSQNLDSIRWQINKNNASTPIGASTTKEFEQQLVNQHITPAREVLSQ